MFHLDKSHDPRTNQLLLKQIYGKQLEFEEAIKETEQLFKQCQENSTPVQSKNKAKLIPFKHKLPEYFWLLFSKQSKLLARTQVFVNPTENIYPDWKPKLDKEFNSLVNSFTREVNVVDFGAIGDGKTDCTAAFKKAIGTGKVKVFVPAGVFITRGIRLPSWTFLVGAGKGITTIKLHDGAEKGTRLVTNTNHWRGNDHIFVGAMSLNWNVERLGTAAKTSTWGNHSSCLTYANVTYCWVRDVEAINPGLHCFDVSSTLYNYGGDGYRARGGSKYVWLDGLNGYGFGDDGITTHHSDNILISQCHMSDPCGRAHMKGFSNSNGIEIDDGSQNVLLVCNSTSRCFGGVEIKAHQNSSAASNIQIVGHISVNDNRSYNFRHIGHHKSTDTESKTAYNILATNLVAIAPVFTELYKDSNPRGLVVSAYKNVVINHFKLIGDSDYDFQNNPVCAIQYRARNVVLNNVSITHFKNASTGFKIFGGPNRADSVWIKNVRVGEGLHKSVDVGLDLKDIKIEILEEVK